MIITAIKRQVKRAGRLSVYVDDHFAFGISENGLLEAKITVGQELSPAGMHSLQARATSDKAYSAALRYVAMRPRSTWEVQTYLKRKLVADDDARQIIGRLTSVQLIDDLAFARAWVANRHLLKPTSQRKLRLELQQKHLPMAIIEQVLHNNQPNQDGDLNNDRSALRHIIAKKQARYPDATKLMQYLARQGFSYDDIKVALAAEEA